MAITDKDTLKSWFKRGLKPLENQFAAWMDSYWHKNESIPTSQIDGLEDVLNDKAESSELTEMGGELALHKKDNTLHKTTEEQSKLDHLANDANETYATKDDVKRLEDVVLMATGEVLSDGRIMYTLDADGVEVVKNAALNGYSLIGAILNGSYTSNTGLVCKAVFVCTYSYFNTSNRDMLTIMFSRVESMKAYSISFTAAVLNGNPVGGVNGGVEFVYKFGDYIDNRYYINNPGTYDLNDFNSSGGIGVAVSDTIIVNNFPAGFTMATGYVLNSNLFCTQVLTDVISHQTVMRIYGMLTNPDGTPAVGWTPWKRIDYTPEDATTVLTGTYTVTPMIDGFGKSITCVMDDESKNTFRSYIKSNSKGRLVLHMTNETGIGMQLECTYVEYNSDILRFYTFSSVKSPSSTSDFDLCRLKITVRKSNGNWIVTANIVGTIQYAKSSEYLFARYGFGESFDMNNFIESGGICCYVDAANSITGANIPEGFTDIYGYVLKNSNARAGNKCCTQVITDSVLQTTMIRHSMMVGTTFTWTPWRRIDCEPQDFVVALTGTYATTNGNKTYTFDDASKTRITDYLKSKDVKPVILHFTADADGLPYEEWTCGSVEILGEGNRRFHFLKVDCGDNSMSVERLHFDVMFVMGTYMVNSPSGYIYSIKGGEYQHDRYVTNESWDMNTFVESGGISAYIYGAITGANMPAGFTDMVGYVLANFQEGTKCKCCTQVVTDRILKKTMMRNSVPTEDCSNVVWLPWVEIGKNSDVYVVAEYPTDLSGYKEGAIIIKQ